MVENNEFARFDVVLGVEDSKMLAGLARSESKVQASAAKMQASVSRFSAVATNKLGQAGGAFSAMAGLSGNATLAMGAQLSGLVAGFATLGPAIAVAAAGVGVLTVLFKADAISQWIFGVDKARLRIKALDEQLEQLNQRKRDQEKLFRSVRIGGFDIRSGALDVKAAGGEDVGTARALLEISKKRLDLSQRLAVLGDSNTRTAQFTRNILEKRITQLRVEKFLVVETARERKRAADAEEKALRLKESADFRAKVSDRRASFNLANRLQLDLDRAQARAADKANQGRAAAENSRIGAVSASVASQFTDIGAASRQLSGTDPAKQAKDTANIARDAASIVEILKGRLATAIAGARQ